MTCDCVDGSCDHDDDGECVMALCNSVEQWARYAAELELEILSALGDRDCADLAIAAAKERAGRA